jgi:hypothetical protein
LDSLYIHFEYSSALPASKVTPGVFTAKKTQLQIENGRMTDKASQV